MQQLIHAATRGHSQFDWLDSWHTFSFSSYHDPARMGFGPLRVINDDRVVPGAGFGTHPHRDMEILSYVTAGVMQHRDSIGTEGTIPAGQFQLMSAGSGIQHSEFNASSSEELRFLQIWIVPASQGGAPRYQQREFPRHAGLQLIASPDGRDGTLELRQDASVSRLILDTGATASIAAAPGRRVYLHLVQGTLQAGEETLKAGDGMALQDIGTLLLKATGPAEALVFDLPGNTT